MPPSSDAFYQHILRLRLQAGDIWGNALIKDLPEVSINDRGWTQETPNC